MAPLGKAILVLAAVSIVWSACTETTWRPNYHWMQLKAHDFPARVRAVGFGGPDEPTVTGVMDAATTVRGGVWTLGFGSRPFAELKEYPPFESSRGWVQGSQITIHNDGSLVFCKTTPRDR